MAVKAATITDVSFKQDGTAMQVVWAAATESDTFAPVKMPEYGARSISIQGTFGSATVVLNGSIDGTNYSGLTNPAGVAISKTSAAVVGVFESTVYYQPAASGGTGQSLTVSMLFVGVRRYPN
jgi:hypothetical protein